MFAAACLLPAVGQAEEHLELGGKLRSAAWEGKVDDIHALIKEGANVDARDTRPGAWTPLMCAAKQKRVEAVRLLLSYGADANYGEAESGETALDLAAWREGGDRFFDVMRGASLDRDAAEQVTELIKAAGGLSGSAQADSATGAGGAVEMV